MFKRLLTIILLACVLCIAASCQKNDKKEKAEGDLIFTYHESTDSYFVQINREIRATVTSITIPGSYNGKPVTYIDEGGFSFCPLLTSVVISEGVTNILSNSFSNCPELTTVVLPEGFTHIGWSAFSNCPKLANINLPTSLTKIDQDAFWNTPLVTETENGLIYVDNWLIGCEQNITDIVIRPGTVGMASHALECKARSLTVNAEMKYIEGYTIGYCSNLYSLTVAEENPLYHSKDDCLIETATGRLVRGCRKSKIPDYITEIGMYAYYGVQAFDNPIIPQSVTKISSCAFTSCGNLRTLTIPASVTELDFAAFTGCTALKQINLPSSITTIPGNCFYMCRQIETIILPDSVTTIEEESAFGECDMLKKLVIPAGVTHLPYDLFSGIEPPAIFYKGAKGVLQNYPWSVYYYSETKPSADHAAYWHFVDGEPTVWSAND